MTAKAMAQRAIANMPDEATFDDIQYNLYVLECIEQGEKELNEGKVFSEEQVLQGMAKWLR